LILDEIERRRDMRRHIPTILLIGVAVGAAITTSAVADVDEFGRNQVGAVAAAIVLSTLRAFLMSFLLLLLASALAIIVELRAATLVTAPVQITVDALESVPIYIWVLAGISWAPKSGAVLAVAIFVIAGLPLAFSSVRGIVRQITQQTYYQAAIALGASDWQLARNHVLPNMVPYLAPLSLHVVGAALAVYGGIGIFGFVNRQELDLGVLLLRAKEQAGHSSTLLYFVVFAFAFIFLGLQAGIHWLRATRDEERR